MANLSADTVVSHDEDQVFTIVEGEAVLMSVSNGKYYRLDDIGTRIWSLIETPTSIGSLCDQLVKEFTVERSACEADVTQLLDWMSTQNLVRLAPSA
jgi:hypothetical protein